MKTVVHSVKNINQIFHATKKKYGTISFDSQKSCVATFVYLVKSIPYVFIQ